MPDKIRLDDIMEEKTSVLTLIALLVIMTSSGQKYLFKRKSTPPKKL